MNNSLAESMLYLIKQGKNPEELMIQYLRGLNSPVADNLAQMAQNKDTQGLEQFARNMCAQTGRDFDTEFKAFRMTNGL